MNFVSKIFNRKNQSDMKFSNEKKNDSEIVKEFYAQYGLAMHTAQILERGLLELYALKRYVNEKLTEFDYYTILSNPDKLSLGKLNNLLFNLKFLDTETMQNLMKANKYRIFLAHQFWWERDIEFNNHNALVNLNKEIFSYIRDFNVLISITDQSINKIKIDNKLNIEEKMGITDFDEREKYIKSLLLPKKKNK